jgi:hypothetical protein
MSKISISTLYGDYALNHQSPLKKQRKEEEEDEFLFDEEEMMVPDGAFFYANFEHLESRLLPIEAEKERWAAVKTRIRRLQADTAALRQQQEKLAHQTTECDTKLGAFDVELARTRAIVNPFRDRDYGAEKEEHERKIVEYRQLLLDKKASEDDAKRRGAARLVERVIAERLTAMEPAQWNALLAHLKTADLLWQLVTDQGLHSLFFACLEGYAVFVRCHSANATDRYYVVVKLDVLTRVPLY